MNQRGMDASAIEDRDLEEVRACLGVSGMSNDMRDLRASNEPRAALAVDLFVHRIGRELGSLAAALGGLDAIVFTGGIGEHDAVVRERVCRQAAWLGIELDRGGRRHRWPAHQHGRSRDRGWVIPTNEELMIARHTLALLDKA